MTRFDVVTIGNALVDVLAYEDHEVVTRAGLERGAMNMVDAGRSEQIYALMGPATERSGGSAANTAAGIASLGGRAAYIGRVADDTFGKVFAHDLRTVGVHFESHIAADDAPTGRCLVLVTPDAQRTMSTYLGTADQLDESYVDEQIIADAAVTYLEGYLFDQPPAKHAFRTAAALAHEQGRKVALTLSDPFCVERHRTEFRALLEDHIDIVFGNEHEITMLYEVDTFDEAAALVSAHCDIAALTCGAAGSVIVSGGERHQIDAFPVEVIDTTGAGDLYAAGFLYGLTHDHDLASCGRLGSFAAGEVISHIGARPESRLDELARRSSLL